jgi:hypothetical protein
MQITSLRHALRLVTILVLVSSSFVQAEDTQHKAVDGLDIYYGILPAEMVLGHEKEHGAGKTGKGAHHLVIALFNTKTGHRIIDAEAEATVTPLGLAGETKKLELMTVNQMVTYGNYFRMSDPLPYRISVKIRLPGAHEWLETIFEYRHS